MTFKFPKKSRLLTAREFSHMRKYGEIKQGNLLQLRVKKTLSQERKLGITVTRKYGNAVQRNQFKRLVREAFRLNQEDFPKLISIHVIAKGKSKQLSLKELSKEMLELLENGQA